MKALKIIPYCLILFLLSFGTTGHAEIDRDDPWTKAQQKSYFGMNGTKIFHIPKQMETTVHARIDMMKELGVLWDRSDWWWHVMEPEKGKFDFSFPDRVVEYFEKNHIQIYPILNYGAGWWKGRNAPLTDEDFEKFGEYVYKTVNRYKDHFTYWSVWNEPNILPFWAPEPNPDHYARLLKIAFRSAKRADPKCLICAPVIAPLGEWDKKFMERLYQLGCKDYFDVFDYHYYRNHPPERDVPGEIADIRALMNRYGDDKPIWISESGVSGKKEGKPDYNDQAALVVRNQLLCLGCGVKKFFYFDLQNWNDDPGQSWDSKLGLLEAGGKKKPAFQAYRTMVKEVDYKTVVGRRCYPDLELETVLFHDPGRNEFILAAWLRGESEEKKKSLEFVCEARDIKLVHPFGDVEILPWKQPPLPDKTSRTISIEMDRHPRYIHGVDKWSYLPEMAVRLSPEKLYMNPGDRQSLKLEVNPLLETSVIQIVKTELPEGFSWDRQGGVLDIGRNVTPGEKKISVVVELAYGEPWDRKRRRLERTAGAIVLPVLDLSLRPYLEGDRLVTSLNLSNRSRWEMNGSLRLEESGGALIFEKNIPQLSPHEILKELVPIDAMKLDTYTEPVEWTLKFGEQESKVFHIHTVPFRDTLPDIDAVLGEWTAVTPLFINQRKQITRGPENWNRAEASAEVFFWFHPEHICVAARVTDDDPLHNENPPGEIWKADSLELYLGFAGPARRAVLDKKVDFQVGVAPVCNTGKPVVFLYHLDKVIEDAEAAARRFGSGYILEAKIPLSAFGEVKPAEGMLLGLDVALDDLDEGDFAPAGNNPGRALMWNGNDRNWIDPSGWGMGILRRE